MLVFPFVARLARADKLALVLIYLGSLFYHLEECVNNVSRSIGRLFIVNNIDTSFPQVFLWERFKTLGPKPAEYDGVEMGNVEDNDGNMKIVPDRPLKMRA